SVGGTVSAGCGVLHVPAETDGVRLHPIIGWRGNALTDRGRWVASSIRHNGPRIPCPVPAGRTRYPCHGPRTAPPTASFPVPVQNADHPAACCPSDPRWPVRKWWP